MAGLKKANVNDELNKVSDEIDAEELRHVDLNTPYQDEDGIVRDVPLLAGYIDDDGILQDTFSYREMNGRDEEAINKADVRNNGAKLVNVLCERCVVAIGTHTKKEEGTNWGKIIRSMLGGDLDYMVFKIRELSKGSEVTFTHTCPNCGQKLTTIIDTSEFNIKPFQGEREISFELNRGYKDPRGNIHKTGVIRLANGFDREVIVPTIRKNPSTATTVLLTRCMKFDDANVMVSQNCVNDMTIKDRTVLEDILKDNSFGIDTRIEGLVCDNCGYVIDGEVGQSDFF